MRKGLNRFLVKNRDKGIPNFMLYLCIANTAVYLYTLIVGDYNVYKALAFDINLVFKGQVWRCVTWLLTYCVQSYGSSAMSLIYVVFYILFNKWLGDVLEMVWGTLRLNLYYLGGALITVVAIILVGVFAKVPVDETTHYAYYLNLSLLLAVATLIPEQQVRLFGIIPLKMRWLAILDLGLILLGVISSVIIYSVAYPTWKMILVFGTVPAISIVNYVLNFGKDVGRLLPIQTSMKQRKRRREFQKGAQPNPNWADNYRGKSGERPYRHKCTVCGRTDTDHPNLEFRYCSRCKGYFCYCSDHIGQHTHIE